MEHFLHKVQGFGTIIIYFYIYSVENSRRSGPVHQVYYYIIFFHIISNLLTQVYNELLLHLGMHRCIWMPTK